MSTAIECTILDFFSMERPIYKKIRLMETFYHNLRKILGKSKYFFNESGYDISDFEKIIPDVGV